MRLLRLLPVSPAVLLVLALVAAGGYVAIVKPAQGTGADQLDSSITTNFATHVTIYDGDTSGTPATAANFAYRAPNVFQLSGIATPLSFTGRALSTGGTNDCLTTGFTVKLTPTSNTGYLVVGEATQVYINLYRNGNPIDGQVTVYVDRTGDGYKAIGTYDVYEDGWGYGPGIVTSETKTFVTASRVGYCPITSRVLTAQAAPPADDPGNDIAPPPGPDTVNVGWTLDGSVTSSRVNAPIVIVATVTLHRADGSEQASTKRVTLSASGGTATLADTWVSVGKTYVRGTNTITFNVNASSTDTDGNPVWEQTTGTITKTLDNDGKLVLTIGQATTTWGGTLDGKTTTIQKQRAPATWTPCLACKP